MTASAPLSTGSSNFYLSYRLEFGEGMYEERKLFFRADSSCPIAKLRFSELQNAQTLTDSKAPCLVAAVFSKRKPPVMYAGIPLVRSLKEKFADPVTGEPIKKILFGHNIGLKPEPNRFGCIRAITTEKAFKDSERFLSFYDPISKESPFPITYAFLRDAPESAVPWIDRCYQQPITEESIDNYIKIADRLLSSKSFPGAQFRAKKFLEKSLKFESVNVIALERMAHLYDSDVDGDERNESQAKRYIEKARDAINTWKNRDVTKGNSKQFIKIVEVLLDESGILKDPESAVCLLEKIIKFDPVNTQSLHKLATLYFHGAKEVVKNRLNAKGLFGRVISSVSAEHLSRFILFGELLAAGGKKYCEERLNNMYKDERVTKEEKKNIQRAWKIHPIYSDSLTKLAAIAIGNKEGDKENIVDLHPETTLENVVEIDPLSWEAFFYLGSLFLLGGHGVKINLKKAREFFQKAVEIDCKQFDPQAALAKLYFAGGDGVLKDYELAKRHAEAAINIKSTDAEISNLLLAIRTLGA